MRVSEQLLSKEVFVTASFLSILFMPGVCEC